MKLKKVTAGRSRQAKETCGQTPEQEEQLKGLGWTDTDIDHMSARQIDIILKKKTRRRRASTEVYAGQKEVDELKKLYDPIVKALDKLEKPTKALGIAADKVLKTAPKDPIAKAAKKFADNMFNQQQMELIRRMNSKAGKARMAAFFRAEGVTGRQAAHHQDGKDWYVDTEFINHSQRVYPGATLRHMGMGEFVLETPDGDIEFDRMRGKKFPGQSGRSHKLYGADKAVAKLLKLMEQKGKSKKATVQAGPPATVPIPKAIRLTLEKLGFRSVKTIPDNDIIIVRWRGKGKVDAAVKALKKLPFAKSVESRDDVIWVKVKTYPAASVKSAAMIQAARKANREKDLKWVESTIMMLDKGNIPSNPNVTDRRAKKLTELVDAHIKWEKDKAKEYEKDAKDFAAQGMKDHAKNAQRLVDAFNKWVGHWEKVKSAISPQYGELMKALFMAKKVLTRTNA
jgi:hypothetical protein